MFIPIKATIADKTSTISLFLRSKQALPLFLLPLFFTGTSVHAAENQEDFSDLSLEQLLQVSIVQNQVSILVSHIHKKGEWMLAFRYMHMDMEDNRDGTSNLSIDEVLEDYAMAPHEMHGEAHMFSIMYSPSDDLTLMAMLPYKTIYMEVETRTGAEFTTHGEGFGDLSLMSNYVFKRDPLNDYFITVMGGISIPTGSINVTDETPAGLNQRLPYPMQLGSGTFDFMVGLNYELLKDNWLFGTHSLATVRLGKNSNDYRLGNILEAGAWVSYGWSSWLSTTFHLHMKKWGNISGADPKLMPAMVPTADPDRRGGTRIDAMYNFDFYMPGGRWKDNQFGVELVVPIYQNLKGPQMLVEWDVTFRWQWIF